MSRVLAFSCVHLMTLETAVGIYEYDGELDYDPFHELCLIIQKKQPDVVVNLGDFTEPFYEDPQHCVLWETTVTAFENKIRFVKVAGNHDRGDGVDHVDIDGYRYEHGHRIIPGGDDSSVAGYVDSIRLFTQGAKLVHGHTHYPALETHGGVATLDVGSVTFSKTYGLIEDGVPSLCHLKGIQ